MDWDREISRRPPDWNPDTWRDPNDSGGPDDQGVSRPRWSLAMAAVAGFAVASTSLLAAIDLDAETLGSAVLMIGCFAIGIMWPRKAGLLGVYLGFYCWSTVLGGGHRAPSYCDFMCVSGPNGTAVGWAVVPLLGFGASLALSLQPGRLSPKLWSALGVASVVAFASCGLAAPANRSFEVSLPEGWTEHTPTANGSFEYAYGVDFSASPSPEAPNPFAGRPTVPTLGVSVFEVDRTSRPCSFDLGVPWSMRDPLEWTPPRPLDAREDLAAYRSPDGDRFYFLTLRRTRLVGIARQPLCYYAVVSVPQESTLTSADAAAILAAFRLR